MMRYDAHIHHADGKCSPAQFVEKLSAAGIDGGAVFSQSPVAAFERDGIVHPAGVRIENVMAFTAGRETLYPFFFIDPTEADAPKQVDMALAAGIAGFKTICTHFYPNDPRAIEVYHRVAASGKPYLFHSGILFDGANASGDFNRPCNFEVLLRVPRLRFALAHVGWPWCDECIAVYAKCQHLRSVMDPHDAPEMFIDTTPGTPPSYRKSLLRKLIAMGAQDHMLWGSDATTGYDDRMAISIRARDEGIMDKADAPEDMLERWYDKNFMRFLKG